VTDAVTVAAQAGAAAAKQASVASARAMMTDCWRKLWLSEMETGAVLGPKWLNFGQPSLRPWSKALVPNGKGAAFRQPLPH
jgi:hypothetical protein